MSLVCGACYSPNIPLDSAGGSGSGTSASESVGPASDDNGEAITTGQAEDADGTTGGTCGDGRLDAGEACDDGVNDGSYGGCMPGCGELGPRCGDGVLHRPEPCDDGDQVDGDGCNSDCVEGGTVRWTASFAAARGGSVLQIYDVAAGDFGVVASGQETTDLVAGTTMGWTRLLDLEGQTTWHVYHLPAGQTTAVATAVAAKGESIVVGGLSFPQSGWWSRQDGNGAAIATYDCGPEVQDIAVGDDGSIALACGGNGEVDIHRFMADGAALWTQPLDDLLATTGAPAIAIDSNSHVIMATSSSGDEDSAMFVRKYAADGSLVWSRLDPGTGSALRLPYAVATGPSGEVVVVGLDAEVPGTEAFIRLLDSEGVEQWTVSTDQFGMNGRYSDAAIDEAGAIVAVGSGNDPDPPRQVLKLGPTGQEIWSVAPPDYVPSAVTLLGNGDIVVAGNAPYLPRVDEFVGFVQRLAP